MSQGLLADRALLTVFGDEAAAFLNRLLTRSIEDMTLNEARYAALLSPQGKIGADFLVCRRREGFLLDCPASEADALQARLKRFTLRAKVTVAAQPDLAVAAVWDTRPHEGDAATFRDPRHDALGWRIVAPRAELRGLDEPPATYEHHRIRLGIPKGGVDFAYGDAFVHDANLDLLHGVDFDKGCYVGQEVVSRVQHRDAARRRIVKVTLHGAAPPIGAALTAGAVQIGTLTSLAGLDGLASARIDRLAEAEAAKLPVLAGETLASVTLPTASTVRPMADGA